LVPRACTCPRTPRFPPPVPASPVADSSSDPLLLPHRLCQLFGLLRPKAPVLQWRPLQWAVLPRCWAHGSHSMALRVLPPEFEVFLGRSVYTCIAPCTTLAMGTTLLLAALLFNTSGRQSGLYSPDRIYCGHMSMVQFLCQDDLVCVFWLTV
jgi:hypothetical protein